MKLSAKPDAVRLTQLETEIKKIADSIKVLRAPKPDSSQMQLGQGASAARAKANQLKALHIKFFEEAHKQEKESIRQQISALEWDLIETTLREQRKDESIAALQALRDQNVKPFFLWRLHFSEAFEGKGGFDVVIANPPYGYIFQDKSTFDLVSRLYESAEYKIDAYTVFVERGLLLTRLFGIASFIIPHTFLSGKYFRKFRTLLSEYDLKNVIVLGKKTFAAAEVDTCVVVVGHGQGGKYVEIADFRDSETVLATDFETYPVESDLVFCACSDVLLIGTPQQIALYARINASGTKLETIGTFYHDIQSRGDDNAISSERLPGSMPMMKGRDFDRYVCRPEIRYFDYKPENIKSGGDLRYHLAPRKIVIRTTADRIIAAIDDAKHLVLNSVNILVLDDEESSMEYVLAILNSKLVEFWYDMTVQETGKTFAEVKIAYLQRIPVVRSEAQVRAAFDTAVRCLTASESVGAGTACSFFERLVDAMVYEVYFPGEIKSVGGEVLRHLSDLPDIQTDWSLEHKMQVASSIYEILSDPRHPVSSAMDRISAIREVCVMDG